MKSTFARFVCRILAASIFALPFHARAGMIVTDQAALEDRGAVAAQLQAFGIAPQDAMARVAALTDAEVAALAERIDALPAGGISGILPILVIALLLWHFANTETPGAKPTTTTKPAPEKK